MKEEIKISDSTANPAPLGLAGFALTTILLNLHNAGFFPLDAVIVSMGIFYGGLAQVFVGIMEWKKKNTFGTTAFTSYGLFWISLVAIWLLPKTGMIEAPSDFSMAAYLALWGIFSLFLFIATLKINRALQVVFGLLVGLFLFLTLGKATGAHYFHALAGWTGIATGAAALYTAMAQVINEQFGRIVMPIDKKK